MAEKLKRNWNFGMTLGVIVAGLAGVSSWIDLETAFNPGLIMFLGIGLFYLAKISRDLKNLREKIESSF